MLRQKLSVEPKVGEHYYCKVRQDILVCLTTRRWDNGTTFQRFLADVNGDRKVEIIYRHDLHTLKRLSEMEVLACVARIVDRRERDGATR
jgi:hypothetical protein